MLHRFQAETAGIPLPARFTYPFCYTPHPLCLMAAEEVQRHLAEHSEWHDELQSGKMFGVLVVCDAEGALGYLAAFSGLLAGSNRHPFFVPPVYDLLQPQGFFKSGEQEISLLNMRIAQLEEGPHYLRLKSELATLLQSENQALQQARAEMKAAKARRDRRREEVRSRGTGLTPEEEQALIGESQYQKAEYKRMERAWKLRTEPLRQQIEAMETQLQQLKEKRKQRSATLQQQLFRQFVMLNGRGEGKDLCDIFDETAQRIPPAGAGECAAPKLLQQAYLNGWKPVAMAEFWWGQSSKTEIRRHGCYYPACRSKCGPILKHMLQGLDVEENPLAAPQEWKTPQILYEDRWMVAVNKPAGLLSVPGKEELPSVYSLMKQHYAPDGELYMVHRLDMATSGILLMARTREVQKLLQVQFASRQVRKRYVARLHGQVTPSDGYISLPLRPDLTDRPRQLVDPVHGKSAVTEYHVAAYEGPYTRVIFYPHTGRTHQLRVHAAHPLGLHAPIVGDELYGTRSARLYLHAESLEFTHPVTGAPVRLFCQAGF